MRGCPAWVVRRGRLSFGHRHFLTLAFPLGRGRGRGCRRGRGQRHDRSAQRQAALRPDLDHFADFHFLPFLWPRRPRVGIGNPIDQEYAH